MIRSNAIKNLEQEKQDFEKKLFEKDEESSHRKNLNHVEVWSISSVILLGRFLIRDQDLYISRYGPGPYDGAPTLNPEW